MEDSIYLGDNLDVLPGLRGRHPSSSSTPIRPSTPAARRRARTLETVADADGDRTGFKGRRYATRLLKESSYRDSFDDYLGFLEPRLESCAGSPRDGNALPPPRLPRGALRQAPLRRALRPRAFLNEIIWAYDYGARASAAGRPSTTRSSCTSRTRRTTTSTPRPSTASRTWRRASSRPRRPPEASCRPTSGGTRSFPDRQGEDRLPDAETAGHAPPLRPGFDREGDWCLDPFAGAGTLGAAAAELGRRYVLIDSNPEAVRVMEGRLAA